MLKKFLILLIFCIALAGYAYYFWESQIPSNKLILYGNVDVRLVDISFRVPGRVEKMLFEEGDVIKAGTLVATLEKTPYISEVKQASANIDSTKANIENAKVLLKRRELLIGSKGVSQEDVDNAKTSLNTYEANLKASEASTQVAMDNLSFTEAYAPTDGIILTRVREPGSVVRETDPVYTISISSPIWIRAFVSERQLGLIRYGMTADIHTDVKGGKVYTGKIGFISPISEFTPKTVETTELRTDLVYRLRIYVDNPDQTLKQGMPVTVTFPFDEEKK